MNQQNRKKIRYSSKTNNMKKILFLLIALVMLPIASSVNAQKRKVTPTSKTTTTGKSTSTTSGSSTDDPYQRALRLCNGENYVQGVFGNGAGVDPKTDKATIEVIPFGDLGYTIILKADGPSFDTLQEATGKPLYYSFSGKNIRLQTISEADAQGFVVMNGAAGLAGLIKVKQGWMMSLENEMQNDGSGVINYEVHKGMTVDEVKVQAEELGGAQLQKRGVQGNYTVYSLLWLDMKKQYDGFGRNNYHYNATNDKEYIRFYFDAKGKLAKWIMR